MYEAKLNYKFLDGASYELPDGRRVVIFNRSKSSLVDKEKSICNDIKGTIGPLESNCIKFARVSEVIYSKRLNSSDMYSIIGYVTEPIKGKPLRDVLLNLNNRDLCKVFGNLFTKFKNYNIPFEYIWMDDNFVFYINILDEKFQIQKSKNFIESVLQNMLENGYNPNALAFLKSGTGNDFSKEYSEARWLFLANHMNAYCGEHDIYYIGSEELCPICSKTKFLVPQFSTERSFKKVWEDLYAKHYSIEDGYNLKIYKKSCNDIAEIEKSVDKIVTLALNPSIQLNLYQDCFIPCKKVLDNRKQFVGYVYKAVQFENDEGNTNVCIDISDINSLKNLPRLKSLIRLILQVKDIISQNLGFMENPFSYVFLSPSHKRQVQILNVELLSEGNVKNTIKWTCDYVYSVLAKDSSIEAKDISKCSNNLDLLLDVLKTLSANMTKYCSIHKTYYNKNYIFCPKCVSKETVKRIKFEKKDKKYFATKEPEAEGGESFIYNYEENTVAKVFKESEINCDLKIIIMLRILEKRSILEQINAENHKYKYIFHKKLLRDPETNSIFGCIMDKVKNAHPISYLRDKNNIKNLEFTLKDVLEILITVGEGIQTLHEKANIFIGDLNGGNILFDSNKNVYFIDFDGMGVDELSPEFCTDGYIDPVSKKNRNITMKDDWYSFAVQAFYYLTYTHPFNGIYYAEDDGKKVSLDIPSKMERRISLLGPHGMEPPAIANSWDWMDADLISTFFTIFEENCRESIVPNLKKQYQLLFSDECSKKFEKIIRVNDKFIAKKFNYFREKTLYVFNSHSAIIKKDGMLQLQMCFEKDTGTIPNISVDIETIRNVVISKDEEFVYLIFKHEVIVINRKLGSKIHEEEIQDINSVVVDENCLYFIESQNGKNNLFARKFMPDGEVLKETIQLGKAKVKCFNVKFNNKFVLVKHTSENVDEIYCNSEKLCDIQCKSANSKYNIIYDDISKSWLVINSEGIGIVIEHNGKFQNIISEFIDDTNVSNIYFEKKLIYIPSEGYLYIVNANDISATKKMECGKIMTPNSKLYDNNAKGFSVLTNNRLYEVRRG